MPSIFGYWSLKGLGQVPRLMLEHVGEPYTDERLNAATEMEKWQNIKKENKHGFAFPNLPYYVDGNVRLTQSAAIIKYLARKHGLAGRSEAELQQLDMLDGQLLDLRIHYGITVYSESQEDFDKKKTMFRVPMMNNFSLLNEFLGSKKYLLGDRITYADFILYDLYCIYQLLDASLVEGLLNVKALKDRIEELPNIAKYIRSDRFIKWPLNGPSAFWGGK